MNDILKQWNNITKQNKGFVPFDFMEIFEKIISPYYVYKKLIPSDRIRIELEVEEAFKGDCEITKECSNKIIKEFSHSFIFSILHKYKKSPHEIEQLINIIKATN